ncbi:hypothetical protein J6590_037943 [Homalodisca vitripennis]|nr:hypothetical protein J6590_037943 [Homalodisca vitripennis]
MDSVDVWTVEIYKSNERQRAANNVPTPPGMVRTGWVLPSAVAVYKTGSKCALVRGGDVHNHETRGRDNFRVQQHRTNAFRNLPSQVGIRLINSLPEECSHPAFLQCAKRNQKYLLLNKGLIGFPIHRLPHNGLLSRVISLYQLYSSRTSYCCHILLLITPLMIHVWGDNVRPNAEVTDLFNNTSDKSPISKSTAQYTVARFAETGGVKDRVRPGRPTAVTDEDGSLDIFQSFIENPNESVRSASQFHGKSRKSFRKVLKKSCFKAYLVTLLQQLS